MTVANRYAAACLANAELGAEAKYLPQLESSVLALQAALKTPAIAAAFVNPRLTPAQRKALASACAKATEAPKALANLLGVLAANRRLNMLPAVLNEIVALLAVKHGITPLTVHIAVPLTEMQKVQLKVQVKQHQKSRDVALTEVLKPELLGGFRAFFGGLVWDTSVAGGLARLKAQLNQTVQN